MVQRFDPMKELFLGLIAMNIAEMPLPELQFVIEKVLETAPQFLDDIDSIIKDALLKKES